LTSSSGGGSLGIIGAFIVGAPLVIIDFIAVLFYVSIQKPQGIAKFISYTALTIVTFLLVYFGIAVVEIFGWVDITEMKLDLIKKGIYPAFLP
jgi:hypothetical protein